MSLALTQRSGVPSRRSEWRVMPNPVLNHVLNHVLHHVLHHVGMPRGEGLLKVGGTALLPA